MQSPPSARRTPGTPTHATPRTVTRPRGRRLSLLLLACCCGHASGFGSLSRLFAASNGSKASAGSGAAACGDAQVECKQWAAAGECEANPGFMLESCPRSCGRCEGIKKVARYRGCEDEPSYNCTEREKRGECDSDKGEMLSHCPSSCGACRFHQLVREALDCEDRHENCGRWSWTGECRINPQYMRENCPVACDVCKEKRRSCNRPPDTPPMVGKGGINETMTRILRDFREYEPEAISWPGGPKGPQAPWVVTLKNFIRDDEAEAFKSTCASHFDRSLAGDQLSPVRTSSQCWCSGNACERHELTQRVEHRIANLTRSQVRYTQPYPNPDPHPDPDPDPRP